MGRQFYHRMGALPDVMSTGEAPSYASWFSDPETAATYTQAQHNGSVATAKYLIKKKLQLGDATTMLDVGGGSVRRAPARLREGSRATELSLFEKRVPQGQRLRRRDAMRTRAYYAAALVVSLRALAHETPRRVASRSSDWRHRRANAHL
eukprot:2898026-Prymnesium_polylepis.1